MARGHRTLSGKGAVNVSSARSGSALKGTHHDLAANADVPSEPTFDGLSAREALKRVEPILWKFEERRRQYMEKISASDAEITNSDELLRVDAKAAGIIPRAEQRALVAAAQAGGDRARHLLTVANQGMVHTVARGYAGLGVSHEDMVQEGNLGLQEAIKRYNFDFADENTFLTYATWWIRQPISKAVQQRGGPMAIPGYLNLVRTRVVQSQAALEGRGIHSPSRQQLIDEVQARSPKPVRVEHIDAAVELTGRTYVSFDAEVKTSDSGQSLSGVIADERVDLDENLDGETLRTAVADSLEVLTSMQRAIITRRFGLEGKRETSAAQMQAELGLTKGQFDNQVKRAMSAMREKMSARGISGLDAYLAS